MPTTPKAIKQAVVYFSDGTTLTVDVDVGANLQGLVFDPALAKKCPAPHGKWPPPGLHIQGGQTPTIQPIVAAADVTAVATGTMTAMAMDAPAPPPPDPPPGCYIVNNTVYCP